MKKRVKDAETEYTDAHEQMRSFEEGDTSVECPHCKKELLVENSAILSELRQLISNRETARERAVIVARESGEAICGMQAVSGIDREYDVDRLYRELESNPALRTQVIKTKYSVNTKAFDMAVRSGDIDSSLRKKVVLRDETKFTVRNQPTAFKLG